MCPTYLRCSLVWDHLTSVWDSLGRVIKISRHGCNVVVCVVVSNVLLHEWSWLWINGAIRFLALKDQASCVHFHCTWEAQLALKLQARIGCFDQQMKKQNMWKFNVFSDSRHLLPSDCGGGDLGLGPRAWTMGIYLWSKIITPHGSWNALAAETRSLVSKELCCKWGLKVKISSEKIENVA